MAVHPSKPLSTLLPVENIWRFPRSLIVPLMVTIGAIAVITGVIIVDHHAHEQVERQIPLARIEAQMHELKFLQEQAETQHELSASFEQDVENVRRNLAEALQELGAHTSDTQAQQVHRSILS